MRDLLFKNLISLDRKKKVICSSEIVDSQGVHSIIRRHFICLIKEIKTTQAQKPLPYLYVLKEHNEREQKEKFFCRIKGSLYAIKEKKLYLVLFTHSLKIHLSGVTKGESLPKSTTLD